MIDTIRSTLIQFFEHPDIASVLAKVPFLQELALNYPIGVTVFTGVIVILLILIVITRYNKRKKPSQNQEKPKVLNAKLRRKLARLRHRELTLYPVEVTEDHMIRTTPVEAESPIASPAMDNETQAIIGNSEDITKNQLSPDARAMLEKLQRDGKTV
jgi:hypothetical protein